MFCGSIQVFSGNSPSMRVPVQANLISKRTPMAGVVTGALLAAALLFSVFVPFTVFADDLDTANAAFDEGRYDEALPAIRDSAEQGRSGAQYLLALAYRDGLGLTRDPSIAAVWFERAAAGGHVQSQYELGVAYLRGRGVGVSGEQAARWLSKAADAGQTDAAVLLASVLLAQGENEEARRRLQQAATAGDLVAAVHLGVLIENGIGGEADPGTAAKWYRQAGQGGEPEGVYRWALLTSDGPDKRLEVMQRSAKAGYSTAQYELAAHLLTSSEDSDAGDGIAWLKSAAESGLPRAQYDLAIAYRDGIGVAADEADFRLWISTAVEAGYPMAQYELAVALSEAVHGFDADYERSFSLYSAAAASGIIEANYGIAYLLSHGFGVQQDFAKAADIFRIAAEAGHVPSQVALGNLYANGQGVAESRQQAERWYCKAARQGHEAAIGFLGGEDEFAAVCSVHEGQESATKQQ